MATIVVYHDYIAINTKLSMPVNLYQTYCYSIHFKFMDVIELTRQLVNYAASAGSGEVYIYIIYNI